MNAKLWIGLAFLTILVAFLIIAFFLKPNLQRHQHGTLRLLSALCAAFAAGFLLGGGLFDLKKRLGADGELAVSGSSGFALFFLIWFTYPSYQEKEPEDSVAIGIPPGSNFEEFSRFLAGMDGAAISLIGFSSEEKKRQVPECNLKGPNIRSLLLQLGRMTRPPIRNYSVTQDESGYILKII